MRPNFLVLFPDAWRHDWLGCAGGIGVQTPVLDALAEKGVRFSECVTPSPLCAPTRAALALGCDYQSCGVLDNKGNLALDRPNFYRNLREAGYSVGGVGKFDLAKGLDDHGGDGLRLLADWGFTHGCDSEGKWDGVREMQRVPITGPYGRFLDSLGLREMYVADMAERRKTVGLISSRASPLDTIAYCDDWVSRSAIEMVRSFPIDRPWFAQVNFPGPHDPFDAPSWVLEKVGQAGLPEAIRHTGFDNETMQQVRRSYAAMMMNIDAWCGKLLASVEERGDAERTIVIFTSDHGEMLGDYDYWGKNVWHEAAIRVPLIFSGPGVAVGRVSKALVQLQDLAATFLDFAHAKPLPTETRSMRSLLANPAFGHRQHLRSAVGKWRAAMDERWKVAFDGDRSLRFMDRASADPDTPVTIKKREGDFWRLQRLL